MTPAARGKHECEMWEAVETVKGGESRTMQGLLLLQTCFNESLVFS